MDITGARKISIVGNSGAGKSTLSHVLGQRLGITVFTIDKIYWLPGWQLRDRQSYKSEHDVWISKDSWIIDGIGYWQELEDRLSKSDMIIFLDVPLKICQERAAHRMAQEKLSPNSDITEGCVYGQVKDRQMEVIDYFHGTLRPKLMNLLRERGRENVKTIADVSDLDTLMPVYLHRGKNSEK